MSIGKSWAITLLGLEGHAIEVEAHIGGGLPSLTVVGLPDTAVNEARQRVRAAVDSTGLAWPDSRVVVNLYPGSIPKTGTGIDLAVAAAILAAANLVRGEMVERAVHLGELGLDGRIRPVRGVFPAVAAAARAGRKRVVVPAANLAEARLIPGIEVHGFSHLAQLVQHYGGSVPAGVEARILGDDDGGRVGATDDANGEPAGAGGVQTLDFSDVLGQTEAVDALEAAAAGRHHTYMLGPPGAGKSMLAARLPGILPPLSRREAVEVTTVHSVCGTYSPGDGLLDKPPFEAPHHTASAAGMIGGGASVARPGAVSRAHRGVLFLDEAPEFSPAVLQTLRQPLETGVVTLDRARAQTIYPAAFQLVMAANPCPCANYGNARARCRCAPAARNRYLNRLSGPLLDRVDIQLWLQPLTKGALVVAGKARTSAEIARRVTQARARAARRLSQTPWSYNAEVAGTWLRAEENRPEPPAWKALVNALETGRVSMRGVDKILRVAWSLTDLEQLEKPGAAQVARAMSWRHAA